MDTNAIPTEPAKFDLNQMAAVMMDREKPPVGFFVSEALWKALTERFEKESGVGAFGCAPQTLHGLKVAIDPGLPDTEFEVAFTDRAWSEKLCKITHQRS